MIRKTILSVALLLASSNAAAQRRPRTTPAQQGTGLSGEADERFRRGITLATENNYNAALVEFRRAYEVSHNALILFNVAAMEIELNHFAEGQDALQEYERSAPAPVVQARRAQIDALSARIRERSGTLTVALTHEGLRVQVDGVGNSTARVVREGAAATSAIRLPIGRYRVTLTAAGFRARESEHDVAANSDVRIDRALDAARAQLTIRANVDGADVKIDGRSVGVTPLPQQDVTEGEHRIEITRAGYTSFGNTITAQGNLGVVEATLRWAPSLPPDVAARFALDLDYPGVECAIDGVRVDCGGSDAVPPGPHTLRVTGRDYLPAEQQVRLESGRTTRVDLRLSATAEAIRESQEVGNGRRRIGYIVGGIGLAAAAGGAAWFAISLSDLQASREAQMQLMMCPPRALPMMHVDCVNNLLEGTGLAPIMAPEDSMMLQMDLEQSASQALVQTALGGTLLGLGTISLVSGIVLVATAPSDRFATLPPRRARLAPQWTPTGNGFLLRF